MLSHPSTQATGALLQYLQWRTYALGGGLALVAISGCQQKTDALPPASMEDAGQAPAPAATAMRRFQVEQIRFSRIMDGRAVPLENSPLASDQTLRIDLSLAGTADLATIEIRVGDTHGNGIFREARSVKVAGRGDFSYLVPAPAGGWESGSYMAMPIVNGEVLEAGSFFVK